MDSLRALVRAGTLTRDEAEAQIKAAQDARQAALEAILTPEQFQKLQELEVHWPGRHRMALPEDQDTQDTQTAQTTTQAATKTTAETTYYPHSGGEPELGADQVTAAVRRTAAISYPPAITSLLA